MRQRKYESAEKLDNAMCDTMFFLREAVDGVRWPMNHPRSKYCNSICRKSYNWMKGAVAHFNDVLEKYNQFCEKEGYEKLTLAESPSSQQANTNYYSYTFEVDGCDYVSGIIQAASEEIAKQQIKKHYSKVDDRVDWESLNITLLDAPESIWEIFYG